MSKKKNDKATLKVSCTIKGQLPVSTVELTQLPDVSNTTECHYLTVNKNYIVFLESMKLAGVEGKVLYRLADLEEIEVTSDSVKNFYECRM